MATKRIIDHRDLLGGFIRVHILHHAVEGEIYGQWMIDELADHGYRLSPGTVYPILHAMEQKGYLKSRKERHGKTERRLYRATQMGRKALAVMRKFLAELQLEVGRDTGGRE